MTLLIGLSALAMGLGGIGAAQQSIDPVAAAAAMAQELSKPQDMGGGTWIRDAHAEGATVVIGFSVPATEDTTTWRDDFIGGMCAPAYKATMDGLFAAGLRVRPEIILADGRHAGAVIDRCPDASPS